MRSGNRGVDIAEVLPESLMVIPHTREPSELQEYGTDWTRVWVPDPAVVWFPRSTQEVAAIVQHCHAQGIAVVPSGGRTGLAAGAVAAHREWVISLAKMNRMDPVDVASLTVRVQAGAVTEAVHHHVAPWGLTWPVDFASKGSSQVGGNIATNAGGVRVVRYGLTRQWVLGLQVVTGTGEILELNGALEKNNTGVDLRQLFIGSEGTLGIITEATLKLTPVAERDGRVPRVLLFGLKELSGVLALFKELRLAPVTLQAYEFFTDRCLRRVQRHRGVKAPFGQEYPFYVLTEVEGSEPESAEAQCFDAWLEATLSREDIGVVDAIEGQNPRENAELWTLREGISESLAATGVLHKNDVALPITQLASFCAQLDAFFARQYPGVEICLFGHIGDGNLHINVMKPDALSVSEFRGKTHQVDRDLFTLVQAHQGSISAEHGIGLLKKEFLTFSRTPLELEWFRGIKRVLDPQGILNPGKVFDL